MKVFVDTNVLVAAVATRGLCADVLRAVLASHELVVSQQVLDEVRRVLRLKIGVSPGPVSDFVRLLQQEADVAPAARLPDVELSDRDDLPILGAAIAARAEVFVTGDRELVELGNVEGMRVLSPRQFWEGLKSRRQRRGGDR
ncbi:MAG: putative toxin-antitoxin system toxin component, PIN family [candidate division WOR-3 bacterium]|nr:putative toxin-antitoxin system toxin component, PIN family [candidate division WOR-3 bacterium]